MRTVTSNARENSPGKLVLKNMKDGKFVIEISPIKNLHYKILDMEKQERRNAIDQIFKDIMAISKNEISEYLPLAEQVDRMKGREIFRSFFMEVFDSLQFVEREKKVS